MKKQIGIWLDFSEAQIIILENGEVKVEDMPAYIDHGKVKGGSHSPSPWGPQQVANEQHLNEKRKHQEKAFYEKLIAASRDGDELYIFGPAEAKISLKKAIDKEANFSPKIMALEVADSMTKPQKIAQVKEFYGFVEKEN